MTIVKNERIILIKYKERINIHYTVILYTTYGIGKNNFFQELFTYLNTVFIYNCI